MFSRYPVVAALCLVTTICFAQRNPEIRLPADPSAVVITFDHRGGYNVGGRVNSNPTLTIRVDGSVTLIDHTKPGPVFQSMISSDELQDLLHLADDQDFFSFDANAVKAAIAEEVRRTGRGFGVGDAPDTLIHIRLADREHAVVYNALPDFARQYPGIKPLTKLLAIEKRLSLLVDQLRVKALVH